MSDSDSDDYYVPEPPVAEDDALRAFVPTSFGKKEKAPNVAAQIEQARRQVARIEKPEKPPKKQKESASDSDASDSDDSDSDSSDSDDEDVLEKFPATHEMVLKTHEKAVTTIALDPAGSRLISGSLDGNISFHDFAAMTPTTLRAFKTINPWESKKSASVDSHIVQHLEFSPHSGSVFLCVTAHPQPKIMSRDGDIVTEFVKGDMYLRDMHNTKGHVGEVITGTWHPTDPNLCVTAGSDSTLRIWDINNKRSQKEVIVFKSKAAGAAGRTRMTAVAWGLGQGNSPVMVAAALDGSLVMYNGNGPFTRPAAEIKDAHRPDTWTGGIAISGDGRMVVTRGGDGLIKLWDTRKFNKALVQVEHASTSDRYPMSNIRYSPDSRHIITGSATGDLHILNPANLRPELVTPVTPGVPLISVGWHSKLNQIILGSANAETRVFFHPKLSTRGALDVMSRAPKKRHVDDDPSFTMDQSQLGISADAIVTPGAGGALGRKRRGGGAAGGGSRDAYRPQVKQITPFMRSQPDEKHVEQNIPLSKMLHEDPREALLKYAEVAKKDPVFTSAWAKTQPVTQYAELSDEEEPDKKKLKK
ncbi:hypothetical protein VTJ04DRAFT_388 [Mycothermus thermophilus]|uniref:uncharacterized protein n=1 Tax=Humicola insolens TaxID=85995 RepID=UPI0037423980